MAGLLLSRAAYPTAADAPRAEEPIGEVLYVLTGQNSENRLPSAPWRNMDDRQTRDILNRQRFIERAGDMLEEHGLPHMTGRVLGALLVCVPPHLSMGQLADQLQASKGSISTATQLLLRLGLIDRVSVPGQRAHAYRLRPNLFSELFLQRTEHLHRHHELAELGLELLRDESAEARRRVVEMKLFVAFVDSELPNLMNRWERYRDQHLRASPLEDDGKDRR
jgi:DNA-binding transcriptional regulator GbsR (MarR family)